MLSAQDGRDLFWLFCSHLNALKFVTEKEDEIWKRLATRKRKVESSPFCLHREFQKCVGAPFSQMAAVQVEVGREKINGDVIEVESFSGIILRWYTKPLISLGIMNIIEKRTKSKFCSHPKDNGKHYDFIFKKSSKDEEMIHFINELFNEMNQAFEQYPIHQTLIVDPLPELLKEFPLYKANMLHMLHK